MKNRQLRILAFVVGVVLAGLLVTGPPTALADTITIGACNGCGVAGPFGTVTLTQVGSNVSVVIAANPGFSWKTADGADIFFNPSVALTASSFEDLNGTVGAISSNNPNLNGLTFGTGTNQNVDGLGTFGFILSGIGTGQVGNVQSVGSWDFTILNVTVAQLEGTNSNGFSWGVHICNADPSSCSPNTFFGANQAPDGGATLMLLGGALISLETLRRKFRF